MSTRYFVFSKNVFAKTGERRSLKNANTREEARAFRRFSGAKAGTYGIYDRFTGKVS